MRVPVISGDLSRDTDVIKHSFVPIVTDIDRVRMSAAIPNPQIDFDACTFEEENVPVPYR